MSHLGAIALSVLAFAPPVALAALGGVLSERAGVINLGLEGIMRFGAFFGAWAALLSGGPFVGLGAGAAAGGAAGALLAALAIWARADQIVAGVALNLLALGLVTFLLEWGLGATGGVTDPVPALPSLAVFGLGRLPWVATLSMLILPALAFVLFAKTPLGLRWRAVGENPRAVMSVGISVRGLRFLAVTSSGVLAGLGGALLPLAVLGRFEDRMPAGQGFIALAAVVFGKWSPLGALGAALFFAAAEALQIEISSSGGALAHLVPRGIFLALPYLLTLLALAGFVGRAIPPAADGVPWNPEER
ncbi:MAG: ABC transporter permease [Deltaproteobacteria bacterium]